VWAEKARGTIIASGFVTSGRKARKGSVVAEGAKSDGEATTSGNNEQYGTRRAPETLPFAARVEGSAPQPPLKGQGEGREAHSVSFFGWANVVRFQDILFLNNPPGNISIIDILVRKFGYDRYVGPEISV
jgi:hypothetical protein